MSYIDRACERIKQCLDIDKNICPANISSAVKAEVSEVLVNYMDLKSLDFRVKRNSDGTFMIAVVGKVDSFYSLKSSMID
mgnify:CR=1 FL=1